MTAALEVGAALERLEPELFLELDPRLLVNEVVVPHVHGLEGFDAHAVPHHVVVLPAVLHMLEHHTLVVIQLEIFFERVNGLAPLLRRQVVVLLRVDLRVIDKISAMAAAGNRGHFHQGAARVGRQCAAHVVHLGKLVFALRQNVGRHLPGVAPRCALDDYRHAFTSRGTSAGRRKFRASPRAL